jgi:acetyltransferase-like isoleucine patch superfamily enzyme
MTFEKYIENRDETTSAGILSIAARYRKFVVCAWCVGRTRLLWGWRLYSLGNRSVLSYSLQVNNPRAVAIGSHVTIASQFILADLCPGRGEVPKIIIGDGCTILYRFQCNAAQSVRIGRNVLIASNVLITDSDHVVEPGGVPVTRSHRFVTRPVCIEDNCWLGQNAVILKGATIGHDSIVGANSTVTHDVPPYSVVAGNPARIIKRLKLSKESISIDRDVLS